jgi:2-polyprenyl-3-methyl-5-hydroxy-6-metoxy-1,4-benzoquinol methylase
MSSKDNRPSLTDVFDRSHTARLKSDAFERIYSAAFGDDYPKDANPNSFFSLTTLREVLASLRVGPNNTIVDLGCGHGGPGLWIAQQSGASLVGIDLSSVGVQLAQDQAASLGLTERTEFRVADLTATGLEDASCDAAMSLDVLLFVPDKTAAIYEVARILRPQGHFAFTTWEQDGYSARLGSLQLADYRPTLEAAGFSVEVYSEPPNWKDQHRALVEGIIAGEPELASDIGPEAAARFAAMARGVLSELDTRRYVFGVVVKG